VVEGRLLTVAEAAKVLRLSIPGVYGLVRSGVVPACRLGRAIRIPSASARLVKHASKPVRRDGVGVRARETVQPRPTLARLRVLPSMLAERAPPAHRISRDCRKFGVWVRRLRG